MSTGRARSVAAGVLDHRLQDPLGQVGVDATRSAAGLRLDLDGDFARRGEAARSAAAAPRATLRGVAVPCRAPAS